MIIENLPKYKPSGTCNHKHNSVSTQKVHFIDPVYKTSTTLFTLSGMGLFPLGGGSCALEGDKIITLKFKKYKES